MKGGFRYRTTIKRKSQNHNKIKFNSKSSKRKSVAGKSKKMRRKSRLGKYKKFIHRRTKRNTKKYRKRQRGGSQPLQFGYINDVENQVLPPRLPPGPYFNTIQGYSANLSNPPISGVTPVTQCTDM